VIIEGAYLVRADSPLKANEDVDRDGVRICVSRGSVYDLFLSRTLKHAQLMRAPSPSASVELFVKERPDALAGVKQPLVAFAAAHPGYRVLPGRFMVIEQAMAVPRGRPIAIRYLRDFIDELKASGFVATSLQKSGQNEAIVAP
jgi:polar amino acid transport system substrate-binding protein